MCEKIFLYRVGGKVKARVIGVDYMTGQATSFKTLNLLPVAVV